MTYSLENSLKSFTFSGRVAAIFMVRCGLKKPSSQRPLLASGPLRTGRDSFPVIRLRPFERLLQGDAVVIRKDAGGEPGHGTLDETGHGYLRSWNRPLHGRRGNEDANP